MKSIAIAFSAALLAAPLANSGMIVLPATVDGDTCGSDDSCEFFFPDSPDDQYQFEVVRDLTRTFHMCGSGDWDSIIAVGDGECGDQAGVGDNLCVLYGGGGHGILQTSDLEPGIHTVTIDGFCCGTCGDYTLQAYCSADVDKDGEIDFADLLAILSRWGQECNLCGEDVNLDRQVTFADILVILQDYGPCE